MNLGEDRQQWKGLCWVLENETTTTTRTVTILNTFTKKASQEQYFVFFVSVKDKYPESESFVGEWFH